MLEHTHTLSARFQNAVVAAFGDRSGEVDPQLRRSTSPEFGDLQCNLAMRLTKQVGKPPREIAAAIVAHLEVDDLCLPPEIAGPGFINLTWRPKVIADILNAQLADARLGVQEPTPAQRVIVDYSSPNVAKQMHVGHLRSTVIGDALARVLDFAGHDVVRQNHLGDWGTQFGMLVEQLLVEDLGDPEKVAALDMPGLLALYQRAKAHFDGDPEFANAARARVVELQSGDPATLALWHALVEASLAEFDATYARLGILLTDDDVAGESTYNPALPAVVADLAELGLLQESDGAQVVFPGGFLGRDGEPQPMIVQKAGGGFGYDATDLAAIRHRVDDIKADRIVYVVDHRQSQHFDMVFAVARKAGWLPEDVEAVHVGFGTVLGPNGKPFKTRSGETVTLTSLLDSAEEAAAANWDSSPEVIRAVANAAVKYADLSNHLERDYVFDTDRMVAMTGNTGPYLQYAHARVVNVLGKAEAEGPFAAGALNHDAERTLALRLTGFAEAVSDAVDTLQPHHITAYLYDVATALSAFYEHCPVIRSEGATRQTRLALCDASRSVLSRGLGLLGIEAPERM